MTLERIDRWLRPEAPAERLALARVLVGAFALVYLLVRFRYFADLSRHDASELAPVGIATVIASPLSPAATWTIAAASVALAAAFVAGARFRVVGPAFFAALLWVTTYRSSWGKILHTENLLVLHVLVLAVSPAADALSLDRGGRAPPAGRERAYGWALRAMSLVTTLTYFMAAVSKLRAGGWTWITGRALGDWLAYDAMRKIELGSFHSPVGPLIAASPVALALLAGYTLVVELAAPLALASPRLARWWAALAWAFHVGVVASMAITFAYPLSGVAYASMFELERVPGLRRLADAIAARLERRRAA